MPIKSNNIDITIPILKKHNIIYVVVVGTSNRLTIKYNRKGILTIRKPYLMKKEELNSFVESHIEWILKHYPEQMFNKQYVTGEEYLLLGNKYQLQVIINKHPDVVLRDSTIIIYTQKEELAKKVLMKWRLEKAETIFSEVLYQCYQKMENDLDVYPKLEIKHYISRWGCCYPKQKKIILNIALIHVPVSLIEYVVFHELSHFVFLNHSLEFHHYLQKYVPDELLKRKKLKEFKSDYE